MRERLGEILKIACYVLAALLFYQLVQTALRLNPLRHVAIPALPALDSETNSLAGAPAAGPARTGTNSPGTNSLAAGASGASPARTNTNSPATNSPVAKAPKEPGTNLVAAVPTKPDATSFTVPLPYPEKDLEKPVALERSTNAPGNSPPKTEMVEANPASLASATNVATNITATTVNSATNLSPPIAMGTNVSMTVAMIGTNNPGTNATTKKKTASSASSKGAMAAMDPNSAMAMMRGGGGGGKSDLPPEIKARVDKIYESELFGQIMRPQPMALQGIAGNSAFLRTPSGQTGLVKEGDSLGEIKLLRIGINRVLVEQDGQKSELTIFNGYGGESLMPKDKDTSK